ncbi:hypothetical protein SUGI_0118390 [Cryptomeria japonica]|nr:hypothetical protein SUGI_0118390 [Cryptomeria japonica]
MSKEASAVKQGSKFYRKFGRKTCRIRSSENDLLRLLIERILMGLKLSGADFSYTKGADSFLHLGINLYRSLH